LLSRNHAFKSTGYANKAFFAAIKMRAAVPLGVR